MAAQILVIGLWLAVASILFIQKISYIRWIVAATLVFLGVIGYLLIQSFRNEVKQRQEIERLAEQLQLSNDQQTTLIRFITHQLKGFMAKSRNIFSMIQEGDFGPVPDPIKPFIQEGFNSATKGAQTIQEILNAANIKSGKVAYAKDPVDLAEIVRAITEAYQPNAQAKGLSLTLHGAEQPASYIGDHLQLENAVRNLIDNSIKYTLQGSIAVTLEQQPSLLRLSVTDTGIGITPEDMQNLFTEGGHGKESQKVNVDSTGFGLYIVKNVVVAHGGKVWAESEGAGKGSRFIVELPRSQAV
jgi:signal transduction histidine kinase